MSVFFSLRSLMFLLSSLYFLIAWSDFKAFWSWCEIKVHMAVVVQTIDAVFIDKYTTFILYSFHFF